MPHTPPLSDDDIAQFIQEGFVYVRGCFSPEKAREIVDGVFGEDGSIEQCYERTVHGDNVFHYANQPLGDARLWDSTRVDVDTGFQTSIAAFSPKLWGAIRQLVGPDRELARDVLGEKWILNTDSHRRQPSEKRFVAKHRNSYWHFDTTSTHSTLFNRFDALTVFILWSKTEPYGGGTLYCPPTIDSVVEALAMSAGGCDTTGSRWGQRHVAKQSRFHSLCGDAGDALIVHPFVLHAKPRSYRRQVRILENSTLDVALPLNYLPTNPRPSPVEACVIERIVKLPGRSPDIDAEIGRLRLRNSAIERLIDVYPKLFLPPLAAEPEHSYPESQPILDEVDSLLFREWVDRQATIIANRNPGVLDAAQAAIRIVRGRMATQRSIRCPPLRDSLAAPDFYQRCFSRLVLGLSNGEGLNFTVAAILVRLGFEVHFFHTERDPEGGGSHVLLLILDEHARWTFVDAWADRSTFAIDGVTARLQSTRYHGRRLAELAPMENVPRLESLVEPAGQPRNLGLHAHRSYIHGALFAEPTPYTRYMHHLDAVGLEAFVRLCNTPSRPSQTNAWGHFLRVRTRHLWDELADPAVAYTTLKSQHRLGGFTELLVDALASLRS